MSVDANIFGRKLKETIIRYLERLCCHSNPLIVLGIEAIQKKETDVEREKKVSEEIGYLY